MRCNTAQSCVPVCVNTKLTVIKWRYQWVAELHIAFQIKLLGLFDKTENYNSVLELDSVFNRIYNSLNAKVLMQGQADLLSSYI